jgi:hypothetical protein
LLVGCGKGKTRREPERPPYLHGHNRWQPLKLHHILSLRSLFSFHYFKFHFLSFFQGAKPLSRDVAVMYEDIGTILPGDEPIPLGITEPLDFAS